MNDPVVLVCLDSPHSFWRLSADQASTLRAAFPSVDFRIATNDTVTGHLAEADVYFGWRFPPDWFSRAPHLRWIASPAAGTDHLPVAEAERAGVALTRSHGFHGRPMAEHAMGLVLGFSRGLFTSARLQATHHWWKDDLAEEFFDLAGSTMAIIGCGSIGSQLAGAARAFGMQVIGVRRRPPDIGRDGITWLPASEVHSALAAADVIVDLLPATRDTHHFFDRAAFTACRRRPLFVNLGRATTVDQTALLAALETGHLRGAALDVTEPRPLPTDHPLRHHPRVVLTPKSAAFSRTYLDGAMAFFARNLHRYLAGKPLDGLATAPPPPAPGG